jgi:uncharacterized membrane protein YdjX (TVP38/TMEM64 family)
MEEKDNSSINTEKEPPSRRINNYVKNLLDFSQYDKKTIIYIIIFAFLIIVSLSLLFYVYFIDNTILYRIVVEWFVNPIFRLGIFGVILFIGIMALQGLIVPLPSELVLLASGMIWGIVLGGFMGVIGSMAAALLCFYVSRKGGRPLAEKFIGEKAINLADGFIHKYGMWAILIARFLPFVAFDPISYAAGLVDMDVKKYSLGTLIGSFPRAFLYSWLGASLGLNPPINLVDLDLSIINAQSQVFNTILLVILGVLVLMFITYYLFARYLSKKQTRDTLDKT